MEIKYRFAGGVDILIRFFEIACVPWVGDIALFAYPLHHERRFVVGVVKVHYVVIIDVRDGGKIGKIVVISYNDLRKQLEIDKIIKGLDYGF